MPTIPTSSDEGPAIGPAAGVLLDIGGVLAFPDGDLLAARLGARLGRSFDPDLCGRSFALADESLGDGMDAPQLVDHIRTWAGVVGAESLEQAAWDEVERLDRARRLWTRWSPEAAEVLSRLRARGIAVAAVSNSNGNLEVELQSAGLLASMDAIFDSTVSGVSKPEPEAYWAAARQLGIDPAACCFVGDSLWEVRGARNAGVGSAVLFAPFATRHDRWRPSVTTLTRLERLLVRAHDA